MIEVVAEVELVEGERDFKGSCRGRLARLGTEESYDMVRPDIWVSCEKPAVMPRWGKRVEGRLVSAVLPLLLLTSTISCHRHEMAVMLRHRRVPQHLTLLLKLLWLPSCV